jgi:hypothetical protein
MGIGEAESRGPPDVSCAVELNHTRRRQLGHITTGRPLTHDFWKCWCATMQLVHVSIPVGPTLTISFLQLIQLDQW